MILKNSEPIHIKVKSMPFKSTERIVLNDYIQCESDDVLKLNFSPTQSEFYDILANNSSDGCIIEVTGVNAGSGETEILVHNQYGEKLNILLNVEVENSWTLIIVLIAIIAGVLLLLFIVFLIIRPKLNGEIEISLSMPEQYIAFQPGKISKRVSGKHKESIGKLFKRNNRWSDSNFGRALNEAGIENDVSKITVTAGFNGGTMIKGNRISQRNNYRCELNNVEVSIRYIGNVRNNNRNRAVAPHVVGNRQNRGRRN